jgi:hypothetical protein
MTSDLVSPRKSDKPARELSPEQAAAAAMVAEAKARRLALTGPDGLLKLFTKNVLETALGEEMTEHLGHDKNRAEPVRESTNVRNGSRLKTVISSAAGEVDINVPRDRESTFEPQIVKKRQRRLTDVDEIVLSLYAKGLTTGEISAHFAEIYGASVSKETISRITDKVVTEMNDWANRPLDAVYAAVFIDAIHVKVRDGQVANRPVYAAIGVTVDGHKDVLGLWMGTGGEGAKFWMSVLVDLNNRGIRDVFFLVCAGLKGLPEVVANVWPQTIVQTCVVHLIRNTFRLAFRSCCAIGGCRGWPGLPLAEPVVQGGVTASGANSANGLADGFFGANQHDEFLGSGDGGVKQVALQHHPGAGGDRDDHAGVFAALGAVDAHRIGMGQFV